MKFLLTAALCTLCSFTLSLPVNPRNNHLLKRNSDDLKPGIDDISKIPANHVAAVGFFTAKQWDSYTGEDDDQFANAHIEEFGRLINKPEEELTGDISKRLLDESEDDLRFDEWLESQFKEIEEAEKGPPTKRRKFGGNGGAVAAVREVVGQATIKDLADSLGGNIT